jgi:hypothetical protein
MEQHACRGASIIYHATSVGVQQVDLTEQAVLVDGSFKGAQEPPIVADRSAGRTEGGTAELHDSA